eukprot:TRINITY_DN16958_c0_g1_i1.p1 TRINITY_DN16958_c0_g1~~TRINITY_DN16958_c0_g1_i1.p1  ORF type:complete len:105 (+),score=0.92 TRINITY_DN16958_c0_g1_i1:344-658(+)
MCNGKGKGMPKEEDAGREGTNQPPILALPAPLIASPLLSSHPFRMSFAYCFVLFILFFYLFAEYLCGGCQGNCCVTCDLNPSNGADTGYGRKRESEREGESACG